MKSSYEAVNAVYNVLQDAGLSYSVYKYNRPTKLSDTEYAIINSLDIDAEVLQKVIVNVNYYCKDIAPGIPDSSKLETNSDLLIGLLTEHWDGTAKIDIDTNKIGWDYALNQHYANIRLSVKLLNN